MALPWVRLDANIGSHDKVLALIHSPSKARWQALSSYMIGLAWSGGQGTDGLIPTHALTFVHGTNATARLLEQYQLWEPCPQGWQIVNFAQRQQLDAVSAGKREAMRVGAARGACSRWHGPHCWKNGHCSREDADALMP